MKHFFGVTSIMAKDAWRPSKQFIIFLKNGAKEFNHLHKILIYCSISMP